MDIKDSVPTAAEFPLPTLGPKLKGLLEEANTGRGFQLIRWRNRRALTGSTSSSRLSQLWLNLSITAV